MAGGPVPVTQELFSCILAAWIYTPTAAAASDGTLLLFNIYSKASEGPLL